MKRRVTFRLLLAVGLLLAACTAPRAETQTSLSPYTLAPVFEDFYSFLGGPQLLGAVLSPGLVEGNLQKQYVEAGLMVYDPALPNSQQFSLAPLGQQLGAWDAPLPDTQLPNALFVDGYIIYSGFEALYRQLGARYVGRPLTGMRLLEEQGRVEQYFENLGFYMELDDPQATPRLMDYGRQVCGQTCGVAPSSPPAALQSELAYGEPFVSAAAAVGQTALGAHLAGPYQMMDGSVEAIYLNAVLYTDPAQPQQVAPRPLPALLGISPQPRVTQLSNPNLVFHPLDGEFGYNVLLAFHDFITQNGGYAFFGDPIQELQPVEGGADQCFVNLCLQYRSGAIMPAPLGALYKSRFYDQASPLSQEAFEQIRIQVWEARPQVSSSEGQVVYASLHANGKLLAGLQPYLVLTLPTGGELTYTFPPTDANGQTFLNIPPVEGKNQDLVLYVVCLEGLLGDKTCIPDSYRIWGNP